MCEKGIYKRIAAIQKKAELAAAARARHEPFSTVRIKSILTDKADVIFRPFGLYGAEEVAKGFTIQEAVDKAQNHGADIFIDLSFCPEWYHAFLMISTLYTDEQKKRFRSDDLTKYPELAEIYDSPDSDECIQTIADIPQSFRLL